MIICIEYQSTDKCDTKYRCTHLDQGRGDGKYEHELACSWNMSPIITCISNPVRPDSAWGLVGWTACNIGCIGSNHMWYGGIRGTVRVALGIMCIERSWRRWWGRVVGGHKVQTQILCRSRVLHRQRKKGWRNVTYVLGGKRGVKANQVGKKIGNKKL